jgi:hypothetical protein
VSKKRIEEERDRLEALLPAFAGIKIYRQGQLSAIPAGEKDTDLAEHLREVIIEHRSHGVMFTPEVFSEIAERIRKMEHERTGETWVNVPEE